MEIRGVVARISGRTEGQEIDALTPRRRNDLMS